MKLIFRLSLFLYSFYSFSLWAQTIQPKPTFSGTFQAPLVSSTDASNITTPHWNVTIQSIYNKSKSGLFNTPNLKRKKFNPKLQSILDGNVALNAQSKTTATNPIIGTNFKGNELKTWTPTDNTIAISNGGIIVSCINYGIEYYDSTGTPMLQNFTWDAFVNNLALNQAKFDPRVLYDAKHDRFITVLLHGFSSTTSKILVCFSKTNNPIDGWNIYHLSGNPYNDTTWTDYPTIGINDDELFINGNRFGDAPNYNWKESYIYQVGLQEGYAGVPLQYGIWNNLQTPDLKDGVTCYPASDGQGKSLKDKMYFVCLQPDSGSKVYLFQLDGNLTSSNPTMSVSQYNIPPYEVCGNAFQKDPTSGNIDSLYTGSAWTQNAFSLGRVIHFTYCADILNGWCGLMYGRIWLDSNRADITSFGIPGSDFAYPAVASLGYDSLDQSVAIAYVNSDSSKTPECGVISVDHNFTWSAPQVVKTGDTSVNILYPPNYPISPERWGDYTGICRKYNSTIPQAWLGAAYGTNTPPRKASFGTWIAQVLTSENPVGLQNITNSQKNLQVIYPNPTHDLFTIEFKNEISGRVSVELYHSNGQLVRILFDDVLRTSINQLSFNKLMLTPGTYFIKASRNKKNILSERLVVH